MGNENHKKIIHLGFDGLPDDEVEHLSATEAQLRRYEEVASNPLGFKTPLLHDLDNPHSHLIIGLTDGTGNDVINNPLYASNVGKLKQQLEDKTFKKSHRIHFEYVAGPGTQRDSWLTNKWDAITGDTSMARAEYAYWKIVRGANEIYEADPRAEIKISLVGFSRGSSQEALVARMLHERGILDLRSEVQNIDAHGNITESYNRHHQAPGRTPLVIGLYDPVPTGALEYLDRRLPPSAVSAFQITAADELRGTFPSDRLLFPTEPLQPDRVSTDGRFREVVVPGKHSDIGGGYLRDGISTKNYNLMTDYLNSMMSRPVIPRLPETDDPRLNVLHESHQGNLIFRYGPKANRDTPQGQIHEIIPDRTHIARPGEVVTRPQPLPEPLAPAFADYLESARPMGRSPLPPPSDISHSEALLARVKQDKHIELKLYEPPMHQRPGVRAAGALGAVGAVASITDAIHTGQRVDTLLAQDNLLGAKHELRDYAVNNANAWVAAYTVGKLGAELGGRRGVYGAVAGGIVGGIAGYVLSEQAMRRLDAREVATQTDALGRQWTFNRREWVSPLQADLDADGQAAPQAFAADFDTRRELDYKATHQSVEIGLARLPPPRNPYRLDANDQDRPSLTPAPWLHDPDTQQWQRNRATDARPNGGYHYQPEVASPERAAQLDRQAADVIQANIAHGPAALAARYDVAHRLNGWANIETVSIPAAIHTARDPDHLQASNARAYQRGDDGLWRHGDEVATGPIAAELAATRAALQPQLAQHARTMDALPVWQTPTQEQRDLAQLANTYTSHGVAPHAETLAAVHLAVNTTRARAGLDPANTALALDPNATGKYDVHSAITHLRRDDDGVIRIAALTTDADIQQARQDIRAQGLTPAAQAPTGPVRSMRSAMAHAPAAASEPPGRDDQNARHSPAWSRTNDAPPDEDPMRQAQRLLQILEARRQAREEREAREREAQAQRDRDTREREDRERRAQDDEWRENAKTHVPQTNDPARHPGEQNTPPPPERKGISGDRDVDDLIYAMYSKNLLAIESALDRIGHTPHTHALLKWGNDLLEQQAIEDAQQTLATNQTQGMDIPQMEAKTPRGPV
ncbi:DUF2235 domain-containing protein, partial [Lysobacter pythonis]